MFSLGGLWSIVSGNWKDILKWVSIGAIGLAVLLIINGWVSNYTEAIETRYKAEAKAAALEAAARTIESDNESLRLDLIEQRKMFLETQTRIKQVNEDLQAIAVVAKEQKKVFEDHDLTRLVTAKPKLIELRANEATRGIFDEIESAVNN